MNGKIKSILVLSAICAVAALLLGVVNYITAPKIAENKAKQERASLSQILKQGEVGEKIVVDDYSGVDFIYLISDKNGDDMGFILGLSGEGYGGTISILANFDLMGNLVDARVTDHSETTAKAKLSKEPFYMKMFIGKGSEKPLPQIKDDLLKVEADVVSSASITFESVAKILNKGSIYVKEKGIQ